MNLPDSSGAVRASGIDPTAAIVPADSRPKICLGLQLRIGGLANIDVALWELG